MLGRVPGKRDRWRPRKNWLSNIIEWTNLLTINATRRAADRRAWKFWLKTSECTYGQMAMDIDDDDKDDEILSSSQNHCQYSPPSAIKAEARLEVAQVVFSAQAAP